MLIMADPIFVICHCLHALGRACKFILKCKIFIGLAQCFLNIYCFIFSNCCQFKDFLGPKQKIGIQIEFQNSTSNFCYRLGEGRGRGFKVILCHVMSLAMHVKIIEALKLEKDLDCQMGLFLPFGLDLLLENKNERNSIIYL